MKQGHNNNEAIEREKEIVPGCLSLTFQTETLVFEALFIQARPFGNKYMI